MKETLIDRLKRSVIEGATKTADYVEEAARLGKLHLDLLSEKRRLGLLQSELGSYVYENIEGGDFSSFKDDNAFAAKVGAITEALANIDALQTKIQEQKQQEHL